VYASACMYLYIYVYVLVYVDEPRGTVCYRVDEFVRDLCVTHQYVLVFHEPICVSVLTSVFVCCALRTNIC